MNSRGARTARRFQNAMVPAYERFMTDAVEAYHRDRTRTGLRALAATHEDALSYAEDYAVRKVRFKADPLSRSMARPAWLALGSEQFQAITDSLVADLAVRADVSPQELAAAIDTVEAGESLHRMIREVDSLLVELAAVSGNDHYLPDPLPPRSPSSPFRHPQTAEEFRFAAATYPRMLPVCLGMVGDDPPLEVSEAAAVAKERISTLSRAVEDAFGPA